MHTKGLSSETSLAVEFQQKAKLQALDALSFLKNHPTFSITLFYLFISVFGICYLYLVSQAFNIEILPHIEFTDFILAPIHYPNLTILSIIMCSSMWLGLLFENRYRDKKFYKLTFNVLNKPFYKLNPLTTYVCLGLMLISMALIQTAESNHRKIVGERTQHYNVSFANEVNVSGDKVNHLENVQIIADSVKYVWVYIAQTEQIHAIPQKNVASLIPVIKRTKNTQQAPEKNATENSAEMAEKPKTNKA